MNVVATGASGFVGRALTSRLASDGVGGVAVSRRSVGELPARWRWSRRAEFLDSVPESAPDAVIHLEVKQHVIRPTTADVEEFETVNVGGTRRWLQWCEKHGVHRFVFFSTIKAVPEGDQAHREAETGAPVTLYGRSKCAAENLVREWVGADAKRCALILRPAVVYGPGNRANIYSMVDALTRGRFFLVGRNDNVKSIVSLTNLCAAVSFLLGRMKAGCEVYQVADSQSHSVRELARVMADELGVKWSERTVPGWAARLGAWVGDAIGASTGRPFVLNSQRLDALLETSHFPADKLQRAGFNHPQSTREGIREMVEWYRTVAGGKR